MESSRGNTLPGFLLGLRKKTFLNLLDPGCNPGYAPCVTTPPKWIKTIFFYSLIVDAFWYRIIIDRILSSANRIDIHINNDTALSVASFDDVRNSTPYSGRSLSPCVINYLNIYRIGVFILLTARRRETKYDE